MNVVIVWSKPNCVQCQAVKRRLTTAGVPFEERDLTAPAHAKDLDYFRGLGFVSAPVTEYAGSVTAGFTPDGIDRVIEAWRAENPQEVA